MKTIILCGGRGTRMKEETEFKPKPLVMVGDKPMVWHIMKLYVHYGYHDFILALGYKGDMLEEYFKKNSHPEFNVTFVDTGLDSLTGERILRLAPHITGEAFMVTYGDGVGDIAIDNLVALHEKQGTIGTLTGAHPHSKYGLVKVDREKSLVTDFDQKPRLHDYVSSGFMVFEKRALDYFDNGDMEGIFKKLVDERQLSLYPHEGFWKSMDTYREMEELNELWNTTRPWAVWEKNYERSPNIFKR